MILSRIMVLKLKTIGWLSMSKWDILIYLVIIGLLLYDISGYVHERNLQGFCLEHVKCIDSSMQKVWENQSNNNNFSYPKHLNTLNVS